MAVRNGTLSPMSVGSPNDWSPVLKYNNPGGGDSPSSPNLPSTSRYLPTTPPTSVGSSADGMLSNGVGRPAGQPSPPSSVARSSTGDGLYAASVRDRESISSQRAKIINDALVEHHHVLRVYLGSSLHDEKGNLRPNRARDKLLRLSSVQFQELSTDVYDESRRRDKIKHENDGPEFLPPMEGYHPKRNQARQKLSTLPTDRFQQLAADVFYELERRLHKPSGGELDRPSSPTGSIASNRSRGPGRGPMRASGNMGRGPPPPGYRGPPPGPGYRGSPGPRGPPSLTADFGRPLVKTFQQNTIVPNKGTMVEDDDDNSGAEVDEEDAFDLEDSARRSSQRVTGKNHENASEQAAVSQAPASADHVQDKTIADLTCQVQELQERAEGLEEHLREREAEIERLKDTRVQADHASRDYDELESRLESAQTRNKLLETELTNARSEASETESQLRTQLEQATRDCTSDASGNSDREQRYKQLDQQLVEQHRITDEVRKEASQFLREMRQMSEHRSTSLQKEEELMAQVSRLEAEVNHWKTRYARSRTQDRHLRVSSTGLANLAQDTTRCVQNGTLVQPDGLIRDVHLTQFQLGIDQLLRAARQSNSEAVDDCMKDIIACVRNIIVDAEAFESPANDPGHDSVSKQAKLKSRVSATASNLITASRNHASAHGLSPVSLLDAAASHLTTSVVELAKMVRIRPTQPDELDHESPAVQPSRLSIESFA